MRGTSFKRYVAQPRLGGSVDPLTMYHGLDEFVDHLLSWKGALTETDVYRLYSVGTLDKIHHFNYSSRQYWEQFEAFSDSLTWQPKLVWVQGAECYVSSLKEITPQVRTEWAAPPLNKNVSRLFCHLDFTGKTVPALRFYLHLNYENWDTVLNAIITDIQKDAELKQSVLRLKFGTTTFMEVRRDNCVLFTDKLTGAQQTRLVQIFKQHESLLDPDIVPFTLPLINGVGVAQDPGKARVSLGKDRVRIICEALDLYGFFSQNTRISKPIACQIIREAFAKNGIRLQKVYRDMTRLERHVLESGSRSPRPLAEMVGKGSAARESLEQSQARFFGAEESDDEDTEEYF